MKKLTKLFATNQDPKFLTTLTRKMSDLVWAVKNGDMDKVKEFIETKVGGGKTIPTSNKKITYSSL